MSSPSRGVNPPTDLGRADRLKRELCAFATAGALKKEYERQEKLFFEGSAPADETEHDSLLDWFLFDWFGETGEGAIDHFLASRPDLADADCAILLDWKDSINSVFEIHALGKTTLTLRELDTSDSFPVSTVTLLDQTPFQRGQCIGARLLPLGERFIFSGLQCIMPDREAALEALEMRRRLEALSSPEALEKAQREQCSAFCEFFGRDELTIAPGELASTLGRFQRYLFEERLDPETGATRMEEFRLQFGQELVVPEMPALPTELLLSGDVTILCDEFDGLVLLPDFNRFKQVFETESAGARMSRWEELVWKYIKDPDIPIVAFERVAEQFPAQVERVFRRLLGDRSFSIEHLYAVLLHYKQPVEGIENLKDDERLWDFFDGTNNSKKSAEKAASEMKPHAKRKRTTAPKAASGKSVAQRHSKTTKAISRPKKIVKRASGSASAKQSASANRKSRASSKPRASVRKPASTRKR